MRAANASKCIKKNKMTEPTEEIDKFIIRVENFNMMFFSNQWVMNTAKQIYGFMSYASLENDIYCTTLTA